MSNKDEYLEDEIEEWKRSLRRANQTVEEWKTGRLSEEYSLAAFEWSDKAIAAAADAWTLTRVLSVLENRWTNPAGSETVVSELSEAIDREQMQLARFPSRSTSAMTNLVWQEKLRSVSELKEQIDRIVDRFSKKED